MKTIRNLLIACCMLGVYSCDQLTTQQDVSFEKEMTSISVSVANEPIPTQTSEISILDANQSGLTSLVKKAELKTITIKVTEATVQSKLYGELKYSKSSETVGKSLIKFLNEPLNIVVGDSIQKTVDATAAKEISDMIVSEEPIKFYLDGKASVPTVFSVKIVVVANLTIGALGE